MKKIFFISFSISLIAVLMLGTTSSARAVFNAMNLVSETNTTYTSKTGTYNTKTIGYGSNSYQTTNKNGSPASVLIVWYCKESYAVNRLWHLYVAIPSNTGLIDGIYSYTGKNTDLTQNFVISVNQENFANEWAYLGYTKGKGGKPDCYVITGNDNSAATGTQEFWMDAMKYYPSDSATPPVYRHSFSQWIP